MDKRGRYYLKVNRADQIASFYDRRLYRTLEILPGALVWATFVILFFLSWYRPLWVAIFVIIFDVYWIAKTIYLSSHMRPSFNKMQQNTKMNWRKKLDGLQGKADSAKVLSPSLSVRRWEDIIHLVVFPMYKEPYDLVRESFSALQKSNYPLDRMIVVLAIEERAGEAVWQLAERIKGEFGSNFFAFLITVHPANIAGELAGKGSNETWAVKEVKAKIIDARNIPYDHIVVSSFDIDTQVLPEYFGVLTYNYLTTPDPLHSSFQPIPVYLNHIWQTPALARVLAFSGTFWQVIQQERPDSMATFSSHSMSFAALAEVGFWQTNVVSEDSRIFWQCFLYYDGKYKITPLFYPISMDANVAPTFWKTVGNQYLQHRRWAYGVENVPYVIFGTLKSKMKWSKKVLFILGTFENYYSWATNSLIIFLFGWAPILFGGSSFHMSVVAYNLPRITGDLMTFATLGLVTSVYFSLRLMPPRPDYYGKHKYILLALEWLMVPFTLNIFSSIPAVESQTRLMLGHYMGFWVTEKTRKSTDVSAAPAKKMLSPKAR